MDKFYSSFCDVDLSNIYSETYRYQFDLSTSCLSTNTLNS